MNTSRTVGVVLLVAGLILLAFGLSASESFASDVKETFTGNPTDRAMWFLIGGGALAVVGVVALFVKSRPA